MSYPQGDTTISRSETALEMTPFMNEVEFEEFAFLYYRFCNIGPRPYANWRRRSRPISSMKARTFGGV
jgi:hypothetical protein